MGKENTETKTPTADDMLRLAAEADGTAPATTPEPPAPSEPKQGDPTKGTPDTTPDPKPPEPPAGQDPQGDDDPEDRPDPKDSPFTKATKEQRRFAKNWRKFQEEREKFQKEREDFERQRQEWDSKRTEPPATGPAPDASAATTPPARPAGPPPSAAPDPAKLPEMSRRYSAEELEALAADLEKDGDVTLAKEARQCAEARRQYDAQAAAWQQHSQQAQQYEQFRRAWIGNLAQGMKDNPDLRNRESPLAKTFEGILNDVPALKQMQDGATLGIQAAKWKMGFDEAEGLRAKLAELEKENQRLRNELTPAGSGTTPPAGTSPTKAGPNKDDLLRLAAAADGLG